MTRSVHHLGGLLAGILMFSAGTALAQSPPPSQGPGGGMRMMEMKRPDPEARAQRLRDVLQLTPAQEPALKAFLEAVRPPQPPKDLEGRDSRTLSTPERLDMQRARLADRLSDFDRRAAATRAFYAQLSANQKKAFDALPPLDGERREIRIERRMMGPGGSDGPAMGRARPE